LGRTEIALLLNGVHADPVGWFVSSTGAREAVNGEFGAFRTSDGRWAIGGFFRDPLPMDARTVVALQGDRRWLAKYDRPAWLIPLPGVEPRDEMLVQYLHCSGVPFDDIEVHLPAMFGTRGPTYYGG
jgi:hypothetical protein